METPEISVTVHPALRELVDSPAEAGTDVVRDSAWALVRTPGLEGSSLSDELQDILAPPDEAVETFNAGNVLNKLKDFFQGSQEVVTGTEQRDINIGVYWIDVPNAPGCTASLQVESETENETGATLKIAGTGGGPSATLTIGKTVSIDDAPQSQVAVVRAPATFQSIELRRGNVTTQFARLASVDWNNRTWYVGPLAPGTRPSTSGGIPAGGVDLTNAGQTSGLDLSHKLGTKWSMSIGIKLDQIGVDASVDVSGTYTQTVTLKYKLAPKHVYAAVQIPPTPGYWWTKP